MNPLDALLADTRQIDSGADAGVVLAASGLAEIILMDAAANRFSPWGQSSVIDANTGTAVLGPTLFHELHDLAELPATWPVGNAGLIHLYGYLLSSVETPYGLKRERWTGGGVARALGLAPETFLPWCAAPTTPLERLTDEIAPIIAAPDAASAVVLWIEEESDDTLATTVVARDPGSGDSALLYAVDGKLQTAFPFSAQAIDALLAEPARLRYNAVAVGDQPLERRRVGIHTAPWPHARART